MKLIDKALIVGQANIEITNCRLAAQQGILTEFGKGKLEGLEGIVDFINTLEVKEIDLNEYARHYLLHEHISPLNEVLHQVNLRTEIQYHKDIEDAYKAGFELGLKAQKGE